MKFAVRPGSPVFAALPGFGRALGLPRRFTFLKISPGARPFLAGGRSLRRAAAGLAIVALFFVTSLRAVIFFATADPDHNTAAPTGELAGSGWQWVGAWAGYQGTPIGPHHFITARHVGGTVGDAFVLDGATYATVAFFDDAASDLRVVQIAETFPSWAPLYRAGGEAGMALVVFGRGLPRGAEVREAATNTLRGWQWGAGDGRLRWGRNTFASSVNGGPYWGALLYAPFNAAGGPEEAHLAVGDSSGPMFVDDGSGWKLAGIAAAVDASFNTTNSGAGFNAAIFDARGLYYGSEANWTFISGPVPIASGFYATPIAAHAAWIDQVAPPVTVTPPSAVSVPAMPAAGVFVTMGLLLAGAAGFLWSNAGGRVVESTAAHPRGAPWG